MPMRHKTKNYNRIPRLNTHKLNAKVKIKKNNVITDVRKCFLYNSLLSHLENIYDENTLYTILLSLGFTEEEIEYEGLTPEDDKNFEILHPEDKTVKDNLFNTSSEKHTIEISCDDCGGCDCEDGIEGCCTKSKVPTETETEETCCGNKYINEENCHDCDGCSCDGKCGSHPCKCNEKNK